MCTEIKFDDDGDDAVAVFAVVIHVAQHYSEPLVPSDFRTAQWSQWCQTTNQSWNWLSGQKRRHFRSTTPDRCASSWFPFTRVSATTTVWGTHSHTRRGQSLYFTVPYRPVLVDSLLGWITFHFVFFAFLRLLLHFNGAPLNYDGGLLYNYALFSVLQIPRQATFFSFRFDHLPPSRLRSKGKIFFSTTTVKIAGSHNFSTSFFFLAKFFFSLRLLALQHQTSSNGSFFLLLFGTHGQQAHGTGNFLSGKNTTSDLWKSPKISEKLPLHYLGKWENF